MRSIYLRNQPVRISTNKVSALDNIPYVFRSQSSGKNFYTRSLRIVKDFIAYLNPKGFPIPYQVDFYFFT